MGYQSFEEWLIEHSDDTACCPDPDPLDMADTVGLYEVETAERWPADVLADHGIEPRMTPVDTLMGGTAQMHFDFAAVKRRSKGTPDRRRRGTPFRI